MKKSVSCETAGKQLLSVVLGSSDAFFDKVIPDIAKELNLDFDLYDKNILRGETMLVCLWAATKALEGDKQELIESIHNSFLEVFDNKKGDLRAVFIDRCNRYNNAWDNSSGGNQSILAMNILSVMFYDRKPDKALLHFFAMSMVQNVVFGTMKSVLEVRKQIKLAKSSKQAKHYTVSDEENEEADRIIRECLRKMNNANKS